MTQVTPFAQSKLKIAGQAKVLTAVEITLGQASEFSGAYHEVNLLDRSGSMYYSLDKAVDTLIRRARAVQEYGGYLSVGWFSSQGQHKMIFKGVQVTEAIIKDLDKLRNTVGATCFSEILKDSAELLEELNKIADVSVVNLLTDGQAVVYDYAKELRDAASAAQAISKRAVALNTIGFGGYYNREFLVSLSNATEFGRFVHIDDVGDRYFETLETLALEVTNTLTSKIQITTGQPTTLIYTAGKVNFVDSEDGIKIPFKNLDRDSLTHTVYLLTESAVKSVTVQIDDEIFEVKKATPASVPDDVKYPALYAIAWDYFLRQNNRKAAFDVVRGSIKDKHIAVTLASAFTYAEVGAAADLLYLAASGHEHLHFKDGKCGPSFMPQSSTTSVFDVLELLANSEGAQIVPFHDTPANKKLQAAREKFTSAYKRTTRKVDDSENVFTKKDGGTVSPLNALVFSEDRLNINVRFTVDGTVKLNNQAAKRVGLDQTQSAFLWRNFSIVKDGQLNTQVLELIVPDDVYNELSKINQKYKGFIRYQEDVKADTRVLIDLAKIPFVRSNTLEAVEVGEIVSRTLRINELEVKQKAVKIVREEQQSKTTAINKTGQFKTFSKEQVQVLQDHGIRHDGSYSGVNNGAAKAEDLDSYLTREVYTYVSGFSSLPSANAIQKKLDASKKLTTSEQAVYDAILQARALVDGMKPAAAVKYLDEVIKSLRKELLSIRSELSMIKLTTVLNNAWFSSIVLDEKDSADLGQNVVLKAKRVTEYV